MSDKPTFVYCGLFIVQYLTYLQNTRYVNQLGRLTVKAEATHILRSWKMQRVNYWLLCDSLSIHSFILNGRVLSAGMWHNTRSLVYSYQCSLRNVTASGKLQLCRNTYKMQLCNRIYYSKVFWRLSMYRAAHRSSSGALNCICSLWFIYPCGARSLPRLSHKLSQRRLTAD